MRELSRILKSDGWAILQVPIDMKRDETYEDFSITDPAERLKHFGQEDHVRIYGQDYTSRLESSGFDVTIDDFVQSLDQSIVASRGLDANEHVFHCRKKKT